MKKRVIKNFMFQSSYQLLLLVLPVFLVPFLSRTLGATGIGLYNYTHSIANYFILLAGFGLSGYGVREIAYVQNDKYERSKIFWEIELLYIQISLLVLAVYLIFSYFSEYSLLYYIQAGLIFATLLDIKWFFEGIEEFKKITIRNFFVKISMFILTILLVDSEEKLPLFLVINSLGTIMAQVTLWIEVRNQVSWIPYNKLNIYRHLRPAISFFIMKISATIFNNLNKTLLGWFATMAVVGIFSNSLTLIIMVGAFMGSANTVLLPHMSSLQKNGKSDEFINHLSIIIHLQIFLCIGMMFGLIAVNNSFVDWFFGPEFIQIKNVIPILAPILVFQQLQQAIGKQYLVPKNDLRTYNYSMIFGTVVNVIISIILIPFISFYGAAIGYLAGQIVLVVIRSKALLKFSAFQYLWKDIVKWLISGLIMVTSIVILTSNMDATVITTVIQVCLGILIYFIVSIVLKSNYLYTYAIKEIKNRLGLKNS